LVLQEPLTIVHLNIVVPPAVTPVMVVVAEFALVMLPGPLIIVQVPVPGAAALAAIVKVLVLHCWISGPAAACGALVRVTSSVVLQTPLILIVHRTTVVEPAVTPVTVELGELGVVTVPGPLCILHAPMAFTAPPVGAGVFPARVNVLVLH
jgi:hypothetical protein